MKISVVITGAPYSTQAPLSAYRFVCAAQKSGHSIYRVFLQGDGVFCANKLSQPPQDEMDIVKMWQELAQQSQLDVVACIASALKRGVLNEEEAKRYKSDHYNIAENMELSGLGQLIDAIHHSDRVITFKG